MDLRGYMEEFITHHDHLPSGWLQIFPFPLGCRSEGSSISSCVSLFLKEIVPKSHPHKLSLISH